MGECAYLNVKDVNKAGAFLDWGLSKDLMVPYAEQHKPLEKGRAYVVYVYLDKTDRIAATTKLDKHLDEFSAFFEPNQAVDLLVCGKSEMGYKAVVDHSHIGLIFKDEAFKPLKYGQRIKGYIKRIRADLKIDLSLQLPAAKGRGDLTEQILQHLEKQGGTSNLTDKASPEDIHKIFNVSKNNYKKALGALYKQRKIDITAEKITLLK